MAARGCSRLVCAETFSLQGLTYGGPIVILVGWLAVSLAALAISSCLAELCSAFPNSGGMYYYSFLLGPPRCVGTLPSASGLSASAEKNAVCVELCIW